MHGWVVGLLLVVTQLPPKPVAPHEDVYRGSSSWTVASIVMALDICSDRDDDTMVWVLSAKDKVWVNTSCRVLKEAVEMTRPKGGK